MEIRFTSIHVDDQEKALAFYTGLFGFKKMADIKNGGYRWPTVAAPEGIPGVELVLEPIAFPPALAYHKALHVPLLILFPVHVVCAVYLAMRRWRWIKK